METVNSIYQLGRVYLKDESTERSSFYVINEQNTGGASMPNVPRQNVLRFRIDDLNSYLLLSRSYLQLRVKVLQSDGVTNLLNGDAGYLAALKNGLHSIFRRAILRINGQSINEYSDYHYYKQDLESLMANAEWKKNMGSLLKYDDPNENLDFDPIAAANINDVANTPNFLGIQQLSDTINNVIGTLDKKPCYIKRVSRSANSREVVANIPLHVLFSFLKAYDRVIRGVSVEMEFELATDTIMIDGSHAGKLAWVGQGATLFVNRVVPSMRVRNELNAMISKGYSLNGFAFEDVLVYKSPTVTDGQGQQDWRIATTVSRPTKVYVAFVQQGREATSTLTSSAYDIAGLQSVQLFVNGQPVPDLRYELNFPPTVADLYNPAVDGLKDKRDRTRAYMDLLASVGQTTSSTTSDLMNSFMSYDNWIHNFPVICFDVSNNLPADTAFTGATELLLRYLHTEGPVQAIAWVYHEKLADIKFTSTESSIVIS